MKAVLVIDIPDEEYGKFSKIGYVSGYTFESDDVYRETFYKYDLKPLPKPITEYEVKVSYDYDSDYAQGWNDCLKEITGEK